LEPATQYHVQKFNQPEKINFDAAPATPHSTRKDENGRVLRW